MALAEKLVELEVGENRTFGFKPRDFISKPQTCAPRDSYLAYPEFPFGLVSMRSDRAPSSEWMNVLHENFVRAVSLVGAYGLSYYDLDDNGLREFLQLRQEIYDEIGVDVAEVVDLAARLFYRQVDYYHETLI